MSDAILPAVDISTQVKDYLRSGLNFIKGLAPKEPSEKVLLQIGHYYNQLTPEDKLAVHQEWADFNHYLPDSKHNILLQIIDDSTLTSEEKVKLIKNESDISAEKIAEILDAAKDQALNMFSLENLESTNTSLPIDDRMKVRQSSLRYIDSVVGGILNNDPDAQSLGLGLSKAWNDPKWENMSQKEVVHELEIIYLETLSDLKTNLEPEEYQNFLNYLNPKALKLLNIPTSFLPPDPEQDQI